MKLTSYPHRTVAVIAILSALMACTSPPQVGDGSPPITPATESRRLIDVMPAVSNIIIGGGMVNCSSMSGASVDNAKCTQPWATIVQRDPAFAHLKMEDISFEAAISHPTFSYSITAERIGAFAALPSRLVSDASRNILLGKLNSQLNEKSTGNAALTFAAFNEALANTPSQLNMAELAALRHSFVDELPVTGSTRKVQARSVAFLNNQASVEIYREFIRAATVVAGGKKPTVGLVTASAENPFNDHDIYYSALRSAGANVVWLPADGGFRKALDRKDCDHTAIDYAAYASKGSERQYFHMDKIFPDLAEQQKQFCQNNAAKFNQTLENLDGVFFTGGNQTRHLESFISRDERGAYTQISPQLEILRQRFAHGKLVVAGSSAGDAVQTGGIWKGKSVPMLGGGESWKVLANGYANGGDPTVERPGMRGTLYANGGLGFFNFGPLDSHFSNRAREARLVRLVSESGMDYGFGVDENTALVVGKPDAQGKTTMAVIGAAGVFVVDVRNAKPTAKGAYGISDVHIHYLTAGDALSIDRSGNLTVQLSENKAVLPLNSTAVSIRQQDILAPKGMHFLKMTQAMGQSGVAFAFGTSEGGKLQDMPLFSLNVSRTPDTVFRDGGDGKLSYTNLALSIEACLDACIFLPQNKQH